MYSYIIGEIIHKEEGRVILENNGIGYEVFVSNQTLFSIPNIGETVKLFLFLQVKEDAHILYGFSQQEEKQVFLQLIDVSGIGPKLAVGILSGIKLSELTNAIYKEDTAFLSKIKGIGKKTAERLCVELKDKITPVGFSSATAEFKEMFLPAVSEAADVLISLGMPKAEAMKLAKENAAENSSVEEIVACSLKNMR